MVRARTIGALGAAVGLVVGVVLPVPAHAGMVEKKTVGGPDGRRGTVTRHADRHDGRTITTVNMTAADTDGRGGRCTETWVDYRTKPHRHLNPGLLVNCSGRTDGVSGAVATDYDGVVGMSVVVCEVPDTSGRINRDESNCRGGLGAMSLHSGERYDDFEVDAAESPGGVRIWRT